MVFRVHFFHVAILALQLIAKSELTTTHHVVHEELSCCKLASAVNCLASYFCAILSTHFHKLRHAFNRLVQVGLDAVSTISWVNCVCRNSGCWNSELASVPLHKQLLSRFGNLYWLEALYNSELISSLVRHQSTCVVLQNAEEGERHAICHIVAIGSKILHRQIEVLVGLGLRKDH